MLSHEEVVYGYQTTSRGLTEREDLQRAFAKMAATYSYYFRRELDGFDGKAFDVPCGYGNFLFFLRSRGIPCHGVDLDPRQVELAQSVGLHAMVGESLTAIREQRGLGLLSCLDFIEHIDKEQAVELLKASYSALKPGGILILRMPSGDGPLGAHDFANDLTHRWLATASAIENLLHALGFEVIRSQDEYPAPVHLKGFLRFVSYHITKRVLSLVIIALGISPPRIWTPSMWVVARRPS